MTNTQIDRLLSLHAELYGRDRKAIDLLIKAPSYSNGHWMSCVSVCDRLDRPVDQFLHCTREEHTIEDAFKACVAKMEPLLRKLLAERRANLSNLIAVLDG